MAGPKKEKEKKSERATRILQDSSLIVSPAICFFLLFVTQERWLLLCSFCCCSAVFPLSLLQFRFIVQLFVIIVRYPESDYLVSHVHTHKWEKARKKMMNK